MGCGCNKGAKVASTNNKTNNKSESNTNSIKPMDDYNLYHLFILHVF